MEVESGVCIELKPSLGSPDYLRKKEEEENEKKKKKTQPTKQTKTKTKYS